MSARNDAIVSYFNQIAARSVVIVSYVAISDVIWRPHFLHGWCKSNMFDYK